MENDDDDFDPQPARSKQQHALVRKAQQERRELATLFDSPLGEAVLSRLEQRFETHLPVFQGKIGHYDALDAMRRDAHREVFLTIRAQLKLAHQEASNNTQVIS
ncbi:MAG: hypothetical protein R3Y56_03160 [Akkermansia sp.]